MASLSPFSFAISPKLSNKVRARASNSSVRSDTINQLNLNYEKESSRNPSSLTLFSPAKINVFLRVTEKREDGYHNLASLFHVITLGDNIDFELSNASAEDVLSADVEGVPLDGRNLIIKALNLYRKKTGCKHFFRIHLNKKIPTGAGLGGGSSNAATALWAANQFNNGLVTIEDLQKWSGEIGSDIPFFFSHGAAYCTGRGEVVKDLVPSPISGSIPMILLKPQEECSTAEVYKNFQLSHAANVDPQCLLRDISKHGISQELCVNDLENPAFRVLPYLETLKHRVLQENKGQYTAILMSGSGSTIVAIGDSKPPPFILNDASYTNLFMSEAYFLTRRENHWYEAQGIDGGI